MAVFNTELAPDEEKRFQAWVSFNKVPWKDSPIADYDMRGFWKGLQTGDPDAKTGVSPFDQRLHFPDKWKTPFHHTFSNESIYAGPGAPKWVGDRLIDRNGRILADETPKHSPAPAYGTTPLGRQLTGKPRSPLEDFIGATSESKPERQVDERFQTQLAVMLGHARTTPAPPELGTATQLGDPTKIVPPSFPRARGSKLEWYSTADLREGGVYEPSTRTIRINDVQKQIEAARKKYPPGTKLQADTWDPRSVMYMPSTLPHEEGHAIWDELETRAFRQLGADQPDIKEALKQGGEALDLMREWHDLHDQFLKNNKALGPYQYANDHSHSFADAFSAWMVDPAKFKNLFPELDSYFKKLAKTK